jgi:hypothetical protein
MRVATAWTAEQRGPRSTRAARLRAMLLAIVLVLLATWAASVAAGPGQPTIRPMAMTPECHQAYRGYMEATDPAEADFWAESWMTFGCETGGGYWA